MKKIIGTFNNEPIHLEAKPIADSGTELDAVLPAGSVVEARFQFALPVAATRRQVLEWINLSLGYGSMSDCPLGNFDVEAIREPVLTDLGMTTDLHEVRDRVIQRYRRKPD
ncbi:hypothetical protein [Microvirga tunisiensis]|uniref:Uncharacterized protein n=1 Tax=Microvirga tunisiensis TaxID=2108360 RepID=A0A5N7MUE3_9HYPH|nr:hypothetical protein [Microvirga tunisiensis]MPR09238.1 hypothetical protein [Microvirga tunisiensis]MPR29704.1 hypothetical protein [Microvirga tunisiensis]